MSQDLTLLLSEDGADPERVEMLINHLRRELVEQDVERVSRLTTREAPEGTRAFEIAALGGLLVTLGDSGEALSKLIRTIRDWLRRSPGPVRTVRVELAGDVLELSHASAADQDRLVEFFISRHVPAEGTSWRDGAGR